MCITISRVTFRANEGGRRVWYRTWTLGHSIRSNSVLLYFSVQLPSFYLITRNYLADACLAGPLMTLYLYCTSTACSTDSNSETEMRNRMRAAECKVQVQLCLVVLFRFTRRSGTHRYHGSCAARQKTPGTRGQGRSRRRRRRRLVTAAQGIYEYCTIYHSLAHSRILVGAGLRPTIQVSRAHPAISVASRRPRRPFAAYVKATRIHRGVTA